MLSNENSNSKNFLNAINNTEVEPVQLEKRPATSLRRRAHKPLFYLFLTLDRLFGCGFVLDTVYLTDVSHILFAPGLFSR